MVAAIVADTTRAYALVQRFGALINLGRIAELSTAMTTADNAVREIPDPYLRGQMHIDSSATEVAFRSLISSRLMTEIELGVSRRFSSVREPESVWVER